MKNKHSVFYGPEIPLALPSKVKREVEEEKIAAYIKVTERKKKGEEKKKHAQDRDKTTKLSLLTPYYPRVKHSIRKTRTDKTAKAPLAKAPYGKGGLKSVHFCKSRNLLNSFSVFLLFFSSLSH